jgi:hypothetical protein
MVKEEAVSKLDSEAVDRLVVLCEEVMRATADGTHRFVEPAAGVLKLATSRQHHIVFGRRGSGKSSLLRKAKADLTHAITHNSSRPVILAPISAPERSQPPVAVLARAS